LAAVARAGAEWDLAGKGLLKEWPKDGPKLLWQVNDIGDGIQLRQLPDRVST
jgi:hypothetical protein